MRKGSAAKGEGRLRDSRPKVRRTRFSAMMPKAMVDSSHDTEPFLQNGRTTTRSTSQPSRAHKRITSGTASQAGRPACTWSSYSNTAPIIRLAPSEKLTVPETMKVTW